jgi:predicted nucleic acid-binding protein
MAERYYWDANLFLEYINGVAAHLPVLDDMLARSRNGEIEIVTSTWSISEVAFAEVERQQRALLPGIEAKIDQLWADRKAIKLIESHEVIHRETRRLLREAMALGLKLQSKDAIHLASAINVKAARLHTFDADFMKLAPLVAIPIEEPSMPQRVLALVAAGAALPTASSDYCVVIDATDWRVFVTAIRDWSERIE